MLNLECGIDARNWRPGEFDIVRRGASLLGGQAVVAVGGGHLPGVGGYLRWKISKWSRPHLSIASMMGRSEAPRGEMRYSERGGSSGKMVFKTSPSSVISLS